MKYRRCQLFVFYGSFFYLLNVVPANAREHWLSQLREQVYVKTADEKVSPKCGLPILAEAFAAENGASLNQFVQNQRLAKKAAAQLTYLSPSGHFLIHYDTTGFDAVPNYDRNGDGFPDYIDFVANEFDRAWEIEIGELAFKIPPDENGQPLAVYPVFCENLSSGSYGATFFDPNADIPALPGFNYTSEISINTDFSFVAYPHISADPILRDSAAIAVTAAHEFNHAIQLGYRIWYENDNPFSPLIDLRYLESSAVYMEEALHDEVNDYYQYLPFFFNNTRRHFGDDAVLYGDVIFHIMTGELYGETITRETWNRILEEPSIPAMNVVFQRKGSDINAELQRLATWMFFCSENAIPEMFFEEAAEYPNPNVIETEPVSLTQSEAVEAFSASLPSLAFQHIKIPVATLEAVSASLQPAGNANAWFASDLFFTSPNSINFPASVFYPVQFTPPQSDVHIAVLSGNWDATSDEPPIDYSLVLRGAGGNLGSEVLAYPNIIKPGQAVSQVTFINLPQDAVVEIFSGNGFRLASIQPESSGQVAFWDLTTSQGNPVASGVYIYRVTSEEKTQTGKIMIIR